MELDELKKSWNALDEHLKDKNIVKEEDLANLINHAKKNVTELSRFNERLRIIAFVIIALIMLRFIYAGIFPDVYYQIALAALIPATGWDIFSSRFLSRTKIDEMPLITVISRFNRVHRWIIRERLVTILFMLFMAGFFFVHRQVWQLGTEMVVLFFAIWTTGFAIPLWVYRKNLGRLQTIKKNLDELKELV